MQLSRAAGFGVLLLVALPSVLGPADATLLLPLTAVSLGTGALATLGLLGAVGLGVAIKKTLYYGGKGHGHDHHYHSHHHHHTGGGYGGAHTGGGYGDAHTGGGYGGAHTGGGYGGAHTGGGYGGGYPSPSYAAPLTSAHRRRRNAYILAEGDRAAVDALVSDDRLGCAQRLVCELAREPEAGLEADEVAILALVSDERATAGVKQLRKAAAVGRGGAACSSLFKNCPFSARDIMAVVRAVADENAN
ncbi:glycine, alanine and asparagine-rich protein-like [Penaeus monodon]|uniref:glycine, alanine and asparagine-rich protein-like n=1 Tax=Penaeus monodon TaxID=6687 RepID=UPI0018A7B444|nr:glycine, alanine and asparagine-rich protein-like [Penaeus monodon]XP_037778090.1 glycine, alanine and asparagine-rich protein-like [Penaeus monodon]